MLSWPAANAALGLAAFTVSDDAEGTTVSAGTAAGELAVRIHRVLRPVTGDGTAPGAVSATWALADGTRARGIFATASREPAA